MLTLSRRTVTALAGAKQVKIIGIDSDADSSEGNPPVPHARTKGGVRAGQVLARESFFSGKYLKGAGHSEQMA
jgi:hypothetical protein